MACFGLFSFLKSVFESGIVYEHIVRSQYYETSWLQRYWSTSLAERPMNGFLSSDVAPPTSSTLMWLSGLLRSYRVLLVF